MTLSNLRQDYIWGANYADERNYFVQIIENPDLLNNGTNTQIHNVNRNATIGYGYDLTRRGAAEIAAFLPAALGGTLSADQQSAMKLIALYKADTVVTIDGHTRELTSNDLINGAVATTSQVTFTENGVATTIALSTIASLSLTQTQATTLLQYTFDFNAGPAYTDKVPGSYGEQIVGNLVAEGREKAALVNLAYNGGSALIGSSLRAAIAADNRAEAWYEIRYNSNNGTSAGNGLAKRYMASAELFSLYDSDGPDLIEAKNIFAMFTKHAVRAGDNASDQTIVEYDIAYAAQVAAANNDFSFPQSDQVQSRHDEFKEAFDILFEKYGVTDKDFTGNAEVLVDVARDSDGTVSASDIVGLAATTP